MGELLGLPSLEAQQGWEGMQRFLIVPVESEIGWKEAQAGTKHLHELMPSGFGAV